eukprot:m.19278 g.19278  ORF g.19278 m.19278 type:complete len:79 (+) comp5908_c0_seq1:420-656(+)
MDPAAGIAAVATTAVVLGVAVKRNMCPVKPGVMAAAVTTGSLVYGAIYYYKQWQAQKPVVDADDDAYEEADEAAAGKG